MILNLLHKSNTMNVAYIAGFFDGEGCLDIQRERGWIKRKGYVTSHPRVRIAQVASSRAVIDMICSQYGGTVYYRKHKAANQNDSVSWENSRGADLLRFLKDIEPYVIVKREQVRLAIWWEENFRHIQVTNNPRINAARIFFAEEISAMKRDPQRLSERAIAVLQQLMRQSEHGSDVVTEAEMPSARAA